MNKTIWKFPLNLGENRFQAPLVFEPLYLDMQDHAICLWALVVDNPELEEKRILISGTGHPVAMKYRYVDSVQHAGFVWHAWHEMTPYKGVQGAPFEQ